MSLIVIDPGHGGKDPGAVANGLQEKDLNLQIALELARLLAAKGLAVRLTRENDRYPALEDRCEIANNLKAGLFLSIHCNASPDRTAHGLEVFHHPASEPGKRLAQAINGELGKLGRAARGVTPADFYVLKHTAMPACLVECGFLTNPGEAEWIKTHVNEITAALAQGIANVLVGAKGQ